MKGSHPATRKLKPASSFLAFTVALLLSAFLPLAAAHAATEPAEAPAVSAITLPSEYGKVIYQSAGDSDKHVYIICQSHRSATTGRNGKNTTAVQAEIYRIGEWLIQNEGVNLLLPEGFFEREEQPSAVQPVSFDLPLANVEARSLDDRELTDRLSDTKVFVNADKLLHETYPVGMKQVEDKSLYMRIVQYLYKAEKTGTLTREDVQRLDYFQEMRSAAMLQKIPAVVEKEQLNGSLVVPKAIWTIGMAHLDEIIKFLKDGRIQINQPGEKNIDELGALDLLEKDYNITIIVPRSLTEDEEAMRFAKSDLT